MMNNEGKTPEETEYGNTGDEKRTRGMSIRFKYTLLVTGILAFVILAVYLLVGAGLEPYTISRKRAQIRSQIALIAGSAEQGFPEKSLVELEKSIRGTSVETVVIDNLQDMPYLVFATNITHSQRMNFLKAAFDSGDGLEDLEIYEKTGDYLICRGYNTRMGNDEIDCVGYVGDDVFYFMAMPMEGIHDSVALVSRFLLAVGLAAILVGSILMYLVTSSLTRPILRLSEISDRMAKLQFNVRYEGKETDEIGILGANINHLSHSLDIAVGDLQAANRQLEADLKEKEELDVRRRQFLSNVSHELKTPIALIQGYAEGLTEGISEDAESRAFYCEVIADEARKMNLIVKRLLNLTEIESGQLRMEPELFDLSELVQEVAESTRMLAGEKKVELKTDLPEELPVKADPFMMESVIQNYLSNAWHYVSDPGRVEITAEKKDGKVKVTVFNTGECIPEEDLPHIWDQFYKVDKARTRSYGGSGIGLSLVKAIMHAHGSTCGVENREGGAAFWFELPQATALPQESDGGGETGE